MTVAATHRPMIGESGYERIALDAYQTPPWCVDVLLDMVAFRGDIWEPACGEGNISKRLEARGHRVYSSDIADHGYGAICADFLARRGQEWVGSIITNPPYEHARAFVDRALWCTHEHKGMVAMLLRNEFDSASSRADLFGKPPFFRKLVLTRRPKWTETKKASPRHNFAWFVWDWQYEGGAQLLYQPRRK